MLAESWELSSDSRQIKLNLRKGVTWHSGREFTSDDVKWNMEWVRNPKIASGALVGQSNWFNVIETPDKHTIILKSDEPRPAVFDFFEVFNIIDREVAEGPNANATVGGTGPFSWAEWTSGVRIRLVKNKNYWASGKPYLDEVHVPDAARCAVHGDRAGGGRARRRRRPEHSRHDAHDQGRAVQGLYHAVDDDA